MFSLLSPGSVALVVFFFVYCYGDHRDLHSFPTRRSSDLGALAGAGLANNVDVPLALFVGEGDVAAGRPGNNGWFTLHKSGTAPRAKHAAIGGVPAGNPQDRKSTRLNSSHANISYAVFCLK